MPPLSREMDPYVSVNISARIRIFPRAARAFYICPTIAYVALSVSS